MVWFIVVVDHVVLFVILVSICFIAFVWGVVLRISVIVVIVVIVVAVVCFSGVDMGIVGVLRWGTYMQNFEAAHI